ncbi:hypothetical protein A2422_01160 [Candidatus Woesebacteria bacterium RIFOXYC1_FULL_31_51]|uniref:Fimbrial assembly family protein n=1 Tax=Candidatus Woesebacteria bacterium GW2011_GWC2_31_9 TaxID=1618586 RepID=A0A0F9YHF6_9BACT|nr:MAG: hypothetical protein UR17_C0001G0682 [Candidatus Woesebacteria bacterium GW2011_GWF1_31_35]KKP22705.1 MAG: hypothetical protein UR11_C0002G0085 [Candidatus Woesebacteria bacterium GW2011_GWC1_30_29]KKP25912.1 MAG: hypothetical protein UR13_C0006G0051 [Candidatus Woesebacteria bacterium GW2011_GWD1_31_12]KKP27139.1 MAG: hypothetical protein UR16_C0006G0028 [Candidatus Woesebacteria bacterium GW2011_GWB1_31_29]KKP30858.1 MAG: hypothetical protein UR21_C0022G0006 [Candidatus Woesebacteria 
MLARKINLIPTEMAVPAGSLKFVKVLNKLSILGVISLILLTISAITLFVFYSIELKKVNSSVASLKNEISSLEKSEQKLILVKDKLGKIAYVKSLDSAENEINRFKKINEIVSVSSDSAFTEVSIGSSKTEVSLISGNSTSLTSILESVANLKDYGKIILSSLGFNPTSGFLTSFIFNSK